MCCDQNDDDDDDDGYSAVRHGCFVTLLFRWFISCKHEHGTGERDVYFVDGGVMHTHRCIVERNLLSYIGCILLPERK